MNVKRCDSRLIYDCEQASERLIYECEQVSEQWQATMVATTFCELATINQTDLFLVLADYPGSSCMVT